MKCKWTYSVHDEMWFASCGLSEPYDEMGAFIANKAKECPYCGKEIEIE